MTWPTDWEWLLVAFVAIGLISGVRRAIRIRRHHRDHRIARFFDWPVNEPGQPTQMYWREGVSRADVENALYGRTDRRWGWLCRPKMRRALVVAAPVSWALTLYGATNLPLSLGFGDSALSWWALTPIPLWLAARRSVRLIADAPEELLDERLVALRDRAYVGSYRGLAAGVGVVAILVIVLNDFAITLSDAALDTQLQLLIAAAYTAIWATPALPSLQLAWTLRDEPAPEPALD